MDNLASSLDDYKVQLSQVEAALSVDNENEELLKLKQDLTEVIQLTEDLIKQESEEPSSSTAAKKPKLSHKFKVGDRCLAFNNSSNKYDEAVVQDLLPEGQTVMVKFDGMDESDICQVSSLKPALSANVPSLDGYTISKQGKLMSKKEKMEQEREYKKKRNLKKKMRLKEKEAESEISKNKWKDFNKKAFSKTSKGKVKKSIFASPEGLDGKVGVGTCGVADKSMTKYEHGAKYNARHLIPR